jgi:hypothetical protein
VSPCVWENLKLLVSLSVQVLMTKMPKDFFFLFEEIYVKKISLLLKSV